MKKSTRYTILLLLLLIPWLWLLFFSITSWAADSLGWWLRSFSDLVDRYTPKIPAWWPVEKLNKKITEAQWDEYEKRPDADPRVLKGRPKKPEPPTFWQHQERRRR